MSVVSSSDKENLIGFFSGSNEGLEELLAQFSEKIYNFCYNLTLNTVVSEEIINKVFLKAVDVLAGSESSVIDWFYTQVIEEVSVRESRGDYELSNSSTSNILKVLVSDDISDLMSDEVNTDSLMRSAIQTLPFEYRVVFLLHETVGFPVSRVAELLSISEIETKAYVHRARLMIFRFLKKRRPEDKYFKSHTNSKNHLRELN
ncbi:MAG: RNA polymerase sigma factor [Proteobacteria bacterium]|nr:RNA polymerase sigma factor [Pseudomonadota bacterium]